MNRASSGVSNVSSLKKVIRKSASRGASVRATKSSKYSQVPLNEKDVRAGRTARVLGRWRRQCQSGRDRGDSNSSRSVSSPANVEREVTIEMGQKYPE